MQFAITNAAKIIKGLQSANSRTNYIIKLIISNRLHRIPISRF